MARAAALAAALAALAGCGGERTFGAQEFVDELNERSVSIELGEPLPNEQEGVEVFALRTAGGSTGAGGHAGGGSLVLAEDAETAESEFRRCEGAVSIVCFRAANVVLMLDGEGAGAQGEAIARGLRELAGD